MKQVLGSKKGTEETSVGTERKGPLLCNGGYDSTCDGLGLGSERVQTSKTYRFGSKCRKTVPYKISLNNY